MKIEGSYYKDGKFWLTEIPIIDFMDQGKTKAEALKLVKSAIEDLVDRPGFVCEVEDVGDGEFTIASDDTKTLAAFILKRMREARGLTIREMAEKLGQKSHTEYARHESGKTAMTLETFTTYTKVISNKDVIKIA